MIAPQDLVALARRFGLPKMPQEHLAAFARALLAGQAAEVEILRRNLSDAQKDNAENAAEAERLKADLQRLTEGLADITDALCGERPLPGGVMLETTKEAARRHATTLEENARLADALRSTADLLDSGMTVAATAFIRKVLSGGEAGLVAEACAKALARARNEGLEKAACVVETADDGVPLQMLADEGLRSLKEPE